LARLSGISRSETPRNRLKLPNRQSTTKKSDRYGTNDCNPSLVRPAGTTPSRSFAASRRCETAQSHSSETVTSRPCETDAATSTAQSARDARGGSLRSRSAAAVYVSDSSARPGTALKMVSLETSGIPSRIAVAAIQRSALRESVADRGAVGAQLGAYRHELGAGVDDLRTLNLTVELEHSRLAPAAVDRPVAQLCGRLEGDERRPAGDNRCVALRQA
jgi:hypothetical protein